MSNRCKMDSPLHQELLSRLGSRLKHARARQGVSASAFALELGISRTTLRSLEAGAPSATIGTYLLALDALGLAGDLALVGTGASRPEVSACGTALLRHSVPATRQLSSLPLL